MSPWFVAHSVEYTRSRFVLAIVTIDEKYLSSFFFMFFTTYIYILFLIFYFFVYISTRHFDLWCHEYISILLES